MFPGDLLEERLASIMRWNALAMVVRANQAYGRTGRAHRQLCQRSRFVESGFNHFFRARERARGSTGRPGVLPAAQRARRVCRAFLEGRLSEKDLMHYRQEITAPAAGAQGPCSYPHPWLMPDFRQFPTGSMGIGPISSIYHARFMRYLTHRNLLDGGLQQQKAQEAACMGRVGDGEMDEARA